MNDFPNEELTDEEAEAWREIELAITDLFDERDIPPNDALNLLMTMASRIAVLCDIPEKDYIEGAQAIHAHIQLELGALGEVQ